MARYRLVGVEGDDIGVEPLVLWDAMEVFQDVMHERPQYPRGAGEISFEWLSPTSAEIWWLPYDHGPTRDTGVRMVTAE